MESGGNVEDLGGLQAVDTETLLMAVFLRPVDGAEVCRGLNCINVDTVKFTD